MNKKKDRMNSPNENFFKLIQNNITPIDLFIIDRLNQGFLLDEIIKLSEKELNIKNASKLIKERVKYLLSEENVKEKLVLNSKSQFIIDPSKLYNNILLIFIKLNLNSLKRNNIEIGPKDIFNTIIEVNSKPQFGKTIKQLFSISSWKYDFFGIVFENNIDRFNSFKNYLLNEDIVETFDIIPIDTGSGFLFNPFFTVDYNSYKEFIMHYKDKMNFMVDELSKKDVDFSKTMRFFSEDEYGLKVISGKNKGDIYPIDSQELKIGRYYDNDIIIQDISVSRRHAKIIKIDSKYIFKDYSTNGSIVNNAHILYDEIELNEKDIIEIGTIKYQFLKLSKKK